MMNKRCLIPSLVVLALLGLFVIVLGERHGNNRAVNLAIIDYALPADYRPRCSTLEQLGTTSSPSVADNHGIGVLELAISGDLASESGTTCLRESANLFALHYGIDTSNVGKDEFRAALRTIESSSPEILLIPLAFPSQDAEASEILTRLAQQGTTIFAAAGNNAGLRSSFPADLPIVTSVGALDDVGKPLWYSAQQNVDVWYPGENLAYIDNSGQVHSMGDTSAASAIAAHTALEHATNSH